MTLSWINGIIFRLLYLDFTFNNFCDYHHKGFRHFISSHALLVKNNFYNSIYIPLWFCESHHYRFSSVWHLFVQEFTREGDYSFTSRINELFWAEWGYRFVIFMNRIIREFKSTETRTGLHRHSAVNPQTCPALYLLNKFFPNTEQLLYADINGFKAKTRPVNPLTASDKVKPLITCLLL
jgi:hypothetical protein